MSLSYRGGGNYSVGQPYMTGMRKMSRKTMKK